MNWLLPLLTSASTAPASSESSSGGEAAATGFSWQDFWATVVNFFRDNVWRIIGWFSALLIGIIFIYFIIRLIRLVMRKREVDPMAIRFVCNIIKFFLWLALILILLAIMGVPVTGLTTGFSAAILAVGVALKDFLSHLAAGIILIISKNYKKGDFIQVNGLEGSIIDINFLFTTLKTYDSTRVTVPNSTMVNHCVVNYEAMGVRRVAINIPVSHDSDLDLVRKTLVDVMKSNGRVHLDPPPLCRLNGIDQDYLKMFLTCYVDIEDYWDVYFYIYDHGYDALKRAGIRIPCKRISVYQAEHPEELPIAYEKLPERAEKVRTDDKIKHISLVDYDELSPEEVARIMAHNKAVRERQKQKASEGKAAKESRKKAAKKKEPKESE